ncbi:MAG: DNA-processing protein DprA, partial [Gemmataceae bacterium]
GALITEATMRAEPTRWRFPARNRIISGLSQVIVIVQAPADSGALITAEHAAEQGRTVLAVPGMVDSANNEGCHRILREGAILCRGVEDILEELDGVSVQATREKSQAAISPPVTREQSPPPGLSDMALAIWNYLGATTRAGDEIARHLGVPIPQLAGLLLTLEMKKVIRRLPGSRYERC